MMIHHDASVEEEGEEEGDEEGVLKYFPRRRNRPAVVTLECRERGSHPVLYWKLLDNLFLNNFRRKLFFAQEKEMFFK